MYDNLDHAQRHGVTRAEIEQVAHNDHTIYPARLRDGTIPQDYYLVQGVTDGGRHVTVVIFYPVRVHREWGVQELDMARPVTAYDRNERP